jgi:hypothetical protein
MLATTTVPKLLLPFKQEWSRKMPGYMLVQLFTKWHGYTVLFQY